MVHAHSKMLLRKVADVGVRRVGTRARTLSAAANTEDRPPHKVLNAYNVPDSGAIPEHPAVDNDCGSVSKSHWDDEWSVEDIQKANQDNVMFTWGPSDGARAGAPLLKYGEGVYQYDRDGKQYMDWTSQAVCNNLGHSIPESVTKAVHKQMETLPYAYSGLAMTEHRARLCNLLAQLLPGDLNGFLFPSSGAEANEGAIRIARRFTGRHKVMTRYRGYHGGTATTMAKSSWFHGLRM